MSIEVDVPVVRWSMIEWRRKSDKPKENARVLIDTGEDVVGGRYLSGNFYSNGWQVCTELTQWAEWPKAPRL